MADWRELAAAAKAREAGRIVVQDGQQSPADDGRSVSARIVTQAAEQFPARDDWGLARDLADAVRRLEHLPPPARLARRDVWAEVVADAMYLARDGWAAVALDLGWSAHDVFGTGPEGSNDYDGLAVWLTGRKLAVIDENGACTTCRDRFYRETYMRPASPRVTPVYLWQFGRVR